MYSTSISLKKETAEDLKLLGNKGDSYDYIVSELIKFFKLIKLRGDSVESGGSIKSD